MKKHLKLAKNLLVNFVSQNQNLAKLKNIADLILEIEKVNPQSSEPQHQYILRLHIAIYSIQDPSKVATLQSELDTFNKGIEKRNKEVDEYIAKRRSEGTLPSIFKKIR